MRGTLPWLALLAATCAVTLLVDPWADDSASDFYLYQPWADAMLDGRIPYRDFEFEYPPLAAPLIAVAGIAGTGYDEYRLAFALLMFVFIALLLVACGRLAELTDGSRRQAMAAVAVSPLLTGAMVRTHFDIAAVAIAVVALAVLLSRRTTLGFVLLGIGTMTKLFPLLLAPVAFAWLWGRGERRAAWRGAIALGVTLVVLAVGWVAISASGAVDSVEYQAERPLQVESNAAFALLAYNAAGGKAPVFVDSHRAQAAEHDLAGPVGVLSTVLGIAAIALLALMAARRREPLSFVLAALGTVVAALAFGKVLSPQFLVWLVPVLAVAAAHRMWALAVSSGGAIALTLVEFPARYDDYMAKDPLAVVVVGLRNLLLLVTLALIVRALAARRAPRALASQ